MLFERGADGIAHRLWVGTQEGLSHLSGLRLQVTPDTTPASAPLPGAAVALTHILLGDPMTESSELSCAAYHPSLGAGQDVGGQWALAGSSLGLGWKLLVPKACDLAFKGHMAPQGSVGVGGRLW